MITFGGESGVLASDVLQLKTGHRELRHGGIKMGEHKYQCDNGHVNNHHV